MILLGKVFEKHPVQFSHRYQPSEVLGPGGPRLRARFVIHKPWHLFVCLFCFLFVASNDKAMTLLGGKKSQYWLRDRMPIFPFTFTSQQYSKQTAIYQVTIFIYKSSPSLSPWQLPLRHSAAWTHLPNFTKQNYNWRSRDTWQIILRGTYFWQIHDSNF